MRTLRPGEKIVKSGTFLHSGIAFDIEIVFSPIRYGSGDFADERSIRDDLEIDSYYVRYFSTGKEKTFETGGICYSTLSDAIEGCSLQDGVSPTLVWCDESAG